MPGDNFLVVWTKTDHLSKTHGYFSRENLCKLLNFTALLKCSLLRFLVRQNIHGLPYSKLYFSFTKLLDRQLLIKSAKFISRKLILLSEK